MSIIFKKGSIELSTNEKGECVVVEYLDPCEGWRCDGDDLSFEDLVTLRDSITKLLIAKGVE